MSLVVSIVRLENFLDIREMVKRTQRTLFESLEASIASPLRRFRSLPVPYSCIFRFLHEVNSSRARIFISRFSTLRTVCNPAEITPDFYAKFLSAAFKNVNTAAVQWRLK